MPRHSRRRERREDLREHLPLSFQESRTVDLCGFCHLGYDPTPYLDEAVVIKACQSGARSAVKRRLSDKFPLAEASHNFSQRLTDRGRRSAVTMILVLNEPRP